MGKQGWRALLELSGDLDLGSRCRGTRPVLGVSRFEVILNGAGVVGPEGE